MNCILKLIKKQKLLRKYKDKEIDWINHIHLDQLLGSRHPAVYLSFHQLTCKIRCYNRIKNLK